MKAVKKAQDGSKVKKQVDSSTVTDTYNPQESRAYQEKKLQRIGKSEFEEAFAAARKAGKETFMFKGKSYNTKLKGEGESRGMTKTVTPLKRMKTGTIKD